MESRSDKIISVFNYLYLIFLTFFCLYPILLAVSTSFSDEYTVVTQGFSLIPKKVSLDTYKYVFQSSIGQILNGYRVTIIVTVLGVLLSMAVTVMYGYALSVKTFKNRNVFAFISYFTMIFSAGLLPWYLICTNVLHLTNTYLALILPQAINPFFMFLMRNFFRNVPYEISESAKIDGAGHGIILFKILLPASSAGLATIAMFYGLNYWNDWYLALMFMQKKEMYPLQYLLYIIISNVQFLSSSTNVNSSFMVKLPTETIKMAITCITIGPIILVYPLIQRYFVKGIIVGAVKG